MVAPLDLVSAKLSEVMLFESVKSRITFVPFDIPEVLPSDVNKQRVYNILLDMPVDGTAFDSLRKQGDHSGIVARNCQVVANCEDDDHELFAGTTGS